MLHTLCRLEPSAQHPAYLCQSGLQLEYLCLIHQLHFQEQTHFQGGNFQLAACMDEVACLQGFWCIFGHDQVFHTSQNGAFDARAQSVLPVLFQFVRHFYNALVEVVTLIDDGQGFHKFGVREYMAKLVYIPQRKARDRGVAIRPTGA